MKILDARVRWMFGWANSPEFELWVDKTPKIEELRYERKGNCWFAEKDGYVSFFSHSGSDHDEGGFSGHAFHITMVDGTEKTLIGPWSSSSSYMNGIGFKHSVEASFTTEQLTWHRGFTFMGGHISLKLAKEAAERCGVKLVKHGSGKPYSGEMSGAQNLVISGGGGISYEIAGKEEYEAKRKRMLEKRIDLNRITLHSNRAMDELIINYKEEEWSDERS